MNKLIKEGDSKLMELEREIDKTITKVHDFNNTQRSIRMRVQTLQGEVSKLLVYRDQLAQAIRYY